MTKFRIRKRVLPFLLAVLTVFMAAFTPYHTIEVRAADIGLTYGIVDSSYEVLQWIFMLMGIGGFQAPNVGVKEDEKGRVVDEFCKEFFCDTWDQWCDQNGIDPSAFKDDFIEVLNQDYDATKYVAGDIKSSVLNTIYSYLYDKGAYTKSNLNFKADNIVLSEGESLSFSSTVNCYGKNSDGAEVTYNFGKSFDLTVTSGSCMPVLTLLKQSSSSWKLVIVLLSSGYFRAVCNGESIASSYNPNSYGLCYRMIAEEYFDGYYDTMLCNTTIPYKVTDWSAWGCWQYIYNCIVGGTSVTDITADIPNVSGKDYAFDLVGWPNTWDIDKPNELPWDGVDSLPIPGDIAIGDSFPGVVDLPGIETGVIDGSIPWPDVIQMIKDIDTTPEPDPEPDPDPDNPDDDVELPAILPDGVSDKLNELKKKFPFCIPFDLVNCVKSVGSSNATPPKFTLEVPIPTTDKIYTFTVNLDMFSPYIGVFKAGIFAIFLIGLMLSTRKLIAWQID